MSELLEKIKSEIQNNKIMIFMKGTTEVPQCGFSAAVVEVFKQLDVPFKTMNIFDDDLIRPTLVSHSEWPTTPQIFINGKFIGGCDIVKELFEKGELEKLVKE